MGDEIISETKGMDAAPPILEVRLKSGVSREEKEESNAEGERKSEYSTTLGASTTGEIGDEEKEELRKYVPGERDKLRQRVCQAKFEISEEDQTVLTAYMNNYVARLTSEKTNLFVFRQRPGDRWEVRMQEMVKMDLKPYTVKYKEGKREKKLNPFEPWSGNENRKEFQAVGFDPTKESPYDYMDEKERYVINRFRGFEAKALGEKEMINMELVQPLLDHIWRIWSRERQGVYDYIIKWLAWLVKGTRKPGTALVFLGEQGSGKGTIANFMAEKVIGKEIARVIQGSDVNHQLLGRFNTDEGKLLTVVDETPDLDPAVWGKLKAMITEAMVSQERKGRDAYMIKDWQSFIFTSNNHECIRPGKGDRRFMICHVSEERVNDFTYFKWIHDEIIDHPDTADNFITYLKRQDIQGWNPAIIPYTEEKEALMMEARTGVEKWAEDVISGTHDRVEKVKGLKDESGKLRRQLTLKELREASAESGEDTSKVYLTGFVKAFGKVLGQKANTKISSKRDSGTIVPIPTMGTEYN